MADISQPAVAAGDAATSLHSELNEMASSSADSDPAAENVSFDIAVASSPSLSVNGVAAVSVAVTSGSPTVFAASCSSTPPTPQSHGSESSPGLHSDPAVTVAPPPYSVHGPSADPSAVLVVPPADSLTQTEPAKSHLPPPPKKPLTPYMRFSKSVSGIFFVVQWKM